MESEAQAMGFSYQRLDWRERETERERGGGGCSAIPSRGWETKEEKNKTNKKKSGASRGAGIIRGDRPIFFVPSFLFGEREDGAEDRCVASEKHANAPVIGWVFFGLAGIGMYSTGGRGMKSCRRLGVRPV